LAFGLFFLRILITLLVSSNSSTIFIDTEHQKKCNIFIFDIFNI
jgi:hypothetical protein